MKARRWILFGAVLLAWSAASIVYTKGLPTSQKDVLDLDELRIQLRTETNAARIEHGLPPLQPDPGLARAAQAHAEENAGRGLLDHGSPDPARDTLQERIGLAGVELLEVGENLSVQPVDVARASVRDWLESPDHRANLLNPGFTHVGFGAAEGAEGTYVAQLFGVRAVSRIGTRVESEIRQGGRWTLDLQAPVGTDAVLFVGSVPVASVPFDTTSKQVTIDALDVPVQATLGVPRSSGNYVPSDVVRLDPDGRWSSEEETADGPAEIVRARFERVLQRGVWVEIDYADDAPLTLLVDGEHRPDVLAEGGVIRAWLPVTGADRELIVGLRLDGGTIRGLERFTLTGDPEPDLLPGTAPPVDTATP